MKTLREMNGERLRLPSKNDTLNPKFWTEDNKLIPEIHNLLVQGATDFVERLGIDPEMIDDIRLVGGNASYNYTDASDLDATIMLNRDMNLSKEDVRRLQISANNLTYRYRPTLEGVDLNFYISTRNVGGLRPAKQSIYSLSEEDFLAGPTRFPEMSPNFLAGKTNFLIELIEECVNDDEEDADECAQKIYETLKKYRVKGLQSRQGEESTENIVWKMLSNSGYIKMLKDKIDELERNYYQFKNPSSIINNEEFKMLVKEGTGVNTIPHSILKWNNRLLNGENPTEMIKRIRPIVLLFLCMKHGLPLTDHSCSL